MVTWQPVARLTRGENEYNRNNQDIKYTYCGENVVREKEYLSAIELCR